MATLASPSAMRAPTPAIEPGAAPTASPAAGRDLDRREEHVRLRAAIFANTPITLPPEVTLRFFAFNPDCPYEVGELLPGPPGGSAPHWTQSSDGMTRMT